MDSQKTIFFRQRTLNGITYRLEVKVDSDNPLRKLPADIYLYEQFRCIISSHAEYIAEQSDKQDTLRTAAEQVREYRSTQPTPLAKAMGA